MRLGVSHPVVRTAANLYLVQGAILVLPLLTLPYLARTLTPANLGLLLFSQAYASVATLVVQYGFDLSASRDVARAGDDRRRIEEIVAGVLSARLVLVGLSALVTVLAGLAIPLFRENPSYLAAAWALSVAQGMSPLWYFLGRERMGVLTILDIGSKIAGVVAVFILVEGDEQGIVVLEIQAVTTAIGVGAALVYMCIRTSFPRFRLSTAAATLRANVQLAMFSMVATAGLYTPPLFVGVLSSPVQVGFYSLADKLQKVPVAALWPLSQALYPRINKLVKDDPRQASRLTRVSAAFFVGIGCVAGGALALAAGWLIPFVFGPGYEPAVGVFRVLALALPFGLLVHVLAYQVLMPAGHDRVLNYVAWAGVGVRLALAVPLTLAYGAVGMAWAVLADAVFQACVLAVVVLSFSNPLFPRVSSREPA